MKFLLPWNDCSILFNFQLLFHLFLYPVKLSSDSSEAFPHRFLPCFHHLPCLYIFPPHKVFACWTVNVSREWQVSPHPAVVSISRLWLLLRGNVRLHRLISILMWHSPEDLTVLSRIKDGTYIARNDLSSSITPQRKCSWFKCLPKLLKTKNFWLKNERQFWDHGSFCLEISLSYEWFLGCLNSDNRWCEKSKS